LIRLWNELEADSFSLVPDSVELSDTDSVCALLLYYYVVYVHGCLNPLITLCFKY